MELDKLRRAVREIADYAEAFREMDDFVTLLAQRMQIAKDLDLATASLTEVTTRLTAQREQLRAEAQQAAAERATQAAALTARLADQTRAYEADLDAKRATANTDLQAVQRDVMMARADLDQVRTMQKNAIAALDAERRAAQASVDAIKRELTALRQRVTV